jgi:hypothetical protein
MDNLDNHSGSRKASSDWHRSEPPNFSRKISTDMVSPRSTYQHEVHISSQGALKEVNKSKLRKVLSGWVLRKEKKEDNWMDQFEKNGIKAGVMIQDEAAMPPIVRY